MHFYVNNLFEKVEMRPLYAAIIEKPTFRMYGRIENANGIMAEYMYITSSKYFVF